MSRAWMSWAHIMGMCAHSWAREEIVERELIGNEESLKQEVSLVGKAVILHITDREFESPTSYPHTHYLSASLMRHILINASCSLMNVPAGTDAFMFDPIIWANVWVWCLLYIIMYVESENVWSEYVEIGIRVNLRLSLFKSSSLFTRIPSWAFSHEW